jgi:GMP synthase-like glutamine amidotransferase
VRILIVDNSIDPARWGAPELCECATRTSGASVWVRRGPQGDLPEDPSQFDRIIVSGSKTSALDTSPWVLKLHEFLRRALDRRTPVLGVCYGHQALIHAIGGLELMKISEKAEVGWTRIEALADSLLFRGLPRKFVSFSSHFQEVSSLPAGLKLTAKSDRCAIQAFESTEGPVFGIQFHPERGVKIAEEVFAHYRRKTGGKPDYLIESGAGSRLYDPKVAERIFSNFIELQS